MSLPWLLDDGAPPESRIGTLAHRGPVGHLAGTGARNGASGPEERPHCALLLGEYKGQPVRRAVAHTKRDLRRAVVAFSPAAGSRCPE